MVYNEILVGKERGYLNAKIVIGFIEKIRTVNINSRGQLVLPEDMRKDLGIKGEATLVLVEKGGEVLIKKESDVLMALEGEELFWKRLSQESMKRAWEKEDDIWDDIAKASK